MVFLPAIPKSSMSTCGYHGFMNVLLMREAHRYKQDCSSSKNRRQTESPQTCLNDRGAKEEDEVKSLENLKENLRKSFYDRFYNIERNEKTNISMMPPASSQILEKIFSDFCAKRIPPFLQFSNSWQKKNIQNFIDCFLIDSWAKRIINQ